MHRRSWPALTSKTHVSGRNSTNLGGQESRNRSPAMASVTLSEQFKSLRDNLKNVVAALENDTPQVHSFYRHWSPISPIILIFHFLHDLFPFQGTVLVTEADQWKQYWSTFESYASSLNQSCHILAISFRSLPLPSTSDTADIVARYTFILKWDLSFLIVHKKTRCSNLSTNLT